MRGPRRAPLASIVADFGSLDAMSVDDDVCGGAITECAALACSLSSHFDASSAVGGTSWRGFGGWLDCKGLPAMRRSVQVVYHTITGCLADTFEMLRPRLPPLVRVTGVAVTCEQNAAPNVTGNHGGIASSTESDASTLKKVPIATDRSVVTTLVAAPDAERRLIPANVAGTVVVTSVGTVPTDATAPAILESLVRLYILAQDPRLQHRPSLAVGRRIGKARHDTDDRCPVDGAAALPKDAAIGVGCHRVLRANEQIERNRPMGSI